MKVRILTLRFDPTEGRFIDDAFVELNESMEVVDCAHHFFENEGLPYLLVIARCREWVQAAPLRPVQHAGRAVTRATESGNHPTRSNDGDGASAHLNPEERRRFDALRNWRTSRARADGVPTYIICRDRTLAQVAQANPTSVTALGEISGLGAKRVAQFGLELLQVLTSLDAPAETAALTLPASAEPGAFALAAVEVSP